MMDDLQADLGDCKELFFDPTCVEGLIDDALPMTLECKLAQVSRLQRESSVRIGVLDDELSLLPS